MCRCSEVGVLSPEDISISAAPTSVKFYSKYTITNSKSERRVSIPSNAPDDNQILNIHASLLGSAINI